MEFKKFKPIVTIKAGDDEEDIPLNSMVECNMGQNGVFTTNCGC